MAVNATVAVTEEDDFSALPRRGGVGAGSEAFTSDVGSMTGWRLLPDEEKPKKHPHKRMDELIKAALNKAAEVATAAAEVEVAETEVVEHKSAPVVADAKAAAYAKAYADSLADQAEAQRVKIEALERSIAKVEENAAKARARDRVAEAARLAQQLEAKRRQAEEMAQFERALRDEEDRIAAENAELEDENDASDAIRVLIMLAA